MSSIRKIQLTGGSTYIVSLPSKWVKLNKLTKGSEVELEEVNGDVLISGKNSSKKSEIVRTVNITDKVEKGNLIRVLTSIYIANFDTLVIKSKDYISPEIREEIKKFSKVVMGVEIFEESSRTMVLQNVLDSESFPISNAVRRMSLNVETMLEDTINGISNNDIDLLDSVVHRDDDVDRYQWYIYREVRVRSREAEKNIYYLILSRILERIADHSANICLIWKSVRNPKDLPLEDLKANLIKSMEMYKASVEAFYANNFSVLNGLIDMKDEIIRGKEKIIGESRGKVGISAISSISEESSRIALYSTDVAELAMDNILSNQLETYV